MKLNKKLFANVLDQGKPWSGRLFLSLICIYLVSILLIAMPNGMSTSLTLNGLPNPACTKTNIQEDAAKGCSLTLQITPRSTAQEYVSFFGGGDPASYVKGALLLNGEEASGVSRSVSNNMVNLSMVDRLRQVNTIGLGMWPPGMFFLNMIPLKLSSDAPLGLYQVLVSSSLWAIAFAIIVSLLATRMRLWLAVVLPFLVMLLELFHDYFFRYGVMYSETYSAALMLIGFSLLFQAIYRKPSGILMLIAGLCFAVASLFRAQIYPVAIGVSVVLIGYCIITMWRIAIKKSVVKYTVILMSIFAFLIGFCLPIGGYLSINNGVLFNADYAWGRPFTTPPFPDAGESNYVALGGMRSACEVDTNKCEELRKKIKAGEMTDSDTKDEVIKAFIHHPISFSIYKLPIAWKYWMAGIGNQYPQVINYRVDNIFILLLFALSLAFMVVQRLWLIFWSSIVTCAMLFAPPFLLHFEGRYFFLMKTFVLFLPLWLLLISNARIKKLVPSLSKRVTSMSTGG